MSNLNIAMTVLVVDDMLTMRKLVMKSLKDMGFTSFVEASDGAIAWQHLTSIENKIGLIISDWNMPNCSGLDLLKRVRNNDKFKKTPFFLVTAESEKEQVIEALRSGVSGYLIKPFDTKVLKEKIIESQSQK